VLAYFLVTVTCTGVAVWSLMPSFHTDATNTSGEVAPELILKATYGKEKKKDGIDTSEQAL
jgi:hypothetical protein